MTDNKLKIIDFSSGIKSTPFNQNFDVIHNWMRRERLRTGGYGIVEGFDMVHDGEFNISIAPGILIDSDGDEIIVQEKNFDCGAPTYERLTEADLQIGADGSIELEHAPYSPSMKRIIRKDSGHITQIFDEELYVRQGTTRLPVVGVTGNRVIVSDQFAGRSVSVEYDYSADRIDAILVDESGRYSREAGINAQSASVASYEPLKRFLIGFAHWHVTTDGIDVEFIVDDRTYRKVYVDGLNRLYLNGRLYREPKFIYFEEPKAPKENDVWYDHQSNALSIWSRKAGVYGWRIVNDFSDVPLRELKMWTEETCPSDRQTFRFGEDETDLRFIPNTNALEIIVDQQVVMRDQYEEIVQEGAKDYLSAGVGFRLKAPLDRATVVQCIVHHIAKNGPMRNVFQRAAIFTTENYFCYSADNIRKVFETELPYVIGAEQLEVFVDGRRLKREDITEMRDAETAATEEDRNSTTKHFAVDIGLEDGQEVSYKISRYVWSYDQLNEMMHEIETKADIAIEQCNNFLDKLENLKQNLEERINDYDERLKDISEKFRTMELYARTKDTLITLDDLDENVRESLFKSQSQYQYNASLVGSMLYDCDRSDRVDVFCQNADGSMLLREGTEYTLDYVKGDTGTNAVIRLDNAWAKPGNTLYINVLRIGR